MLIISIISAITGNVAFGRNLKDALDQYLEVTVTGGRSDATQWRRSSICNGGNCVEVSSLGLAVAVRDSADPDGVILTFPSSSWRELIADVKAATLGSAS
jgi:hypothetical protein